MACGRDGRSRGRGDRAGAGGGVCRTAPAASSGGTGEGRAGGFRALVKCGGGAAWKRGQGLREAGRGPRSAAAEQGAQARRAEKGDVCKVGRRRGLGAGAGGVVRKGDVRKAGGRAVRERAQARRAEKGDDCKARRRRGSGGRRGGGLSFWTGGILQKSFRFFREAEDWRRRCADASPRVLVREAGADAPARITLKGAGKGGRIFPRASGSENPCLPKARICGKLIYIASIEILYFLGLRNKPPERLRIHAEGASCGSPDEALARGRPPLP